MSEATSELGSTGLRINGGVVTEEFLTKLRGSQGRRTYREMSENSPVIGGILLAFEKTISRLDWRIEPGDVEQGGVEEDANFVQGALDDMSESFDAIIGNIFSFATYGWAFHEIVYKRRLGATDDPATRSRFSDGKIGWRKWPIRSQDSLKEWVTDDEGGVQGFRQVVDGQPDVIIPIEKALLFRTTTAKGNPEGRSMLRNAYRPHYFVKRIEEIEAIGIERDLAGLPVAFMHPQYLASNASQADKALREAVTQIVQGIKRNEMDGVLFPLAYDEAGNKMLDLQLLSSGGSRQFNTDQIIARYNQQIAMSVLADFLLLGHEGVGSYALGASKIDLWMMAVEALAKSIAEVINTHAIPRLLKLNGMSTEAPPKITFGDVAHIDLGALGDFIQKMQGAGVLTPDDRLEEFVRDAANLPQAEDPDPREDMGVPTKRTPPPPPGAGDGSEDGDDDEAQGIPPIAA